MACSGLKNGGKCATLTDQCGHRYELRDGNVAALAEPRVRHGGPIAEQHAQIAAQESMHVVEVGLVEFGALCDSVNIVKLLVLETLRKYIGLSMKLFRLETFCLRR